MRSRPVEIARGLGMDRCPAAGACSRQALPMPGRPLSQGGDRGFRRRHRKDSFSGKESAGCGRNQRSLPIQNLCRSPSSGYLKNSRRRRRRWLRGGIRLDARPRSGITRTDLSLTPIVLPFVLYFFACLFAYLPGIYLSLLFCWFVCLFVEGGYTPSTRSAAPRVLFRTATPPVLHAPSCH